MNKINLAILQGGNSLERNVSISSVNNILENINKDKYNINVLTLPNDNTTSWINKLTDLSPNIVLNMVHGGNGENGCIQGLLQCFNIPYVGSNILASSICINKNMCKNIIEKFYIPTINDVFIPKNSNIFEYEETINKLGYPLIVKPNNGGSSIGISFVNNYNELKNAVKIVNNLNDDTLIEKYIDGDEVTCGLIETENSLKILPVLDIRTKNKFYSYSSKYGKDDRKIEFCNLPEFIKDMIKEIAKKVFNILNCNGYVNVDMIVKEEQVYVLEVNTIPGLTKYSLMPKAIENTDLTFSEFLDLLIKFELNKCQRIS